MTEYTRGTPSLVTGSMYISGTETISLTTANTPLVVKPFVEGVSRGTTLDGTNGTITILTTGLYKISITVSLNASKIATLHGHLLIDSTHSVEIEFERGVSASGAIGNAGADGILSLTAGSVLGTCIESTATNTDVNFVHAQFSVIGLGP